MQASRKEAILADIALVFMALIWGSGFVFMKSSLDAFAPIEIIALRMFIGSAVLALFSIKRLSKLKPKDLLAGLLIGITLFFGFYFQTVGLQSTPAGKTAFLTATYVVMVPFVLVIFMHKKIGWHNIAAAVLTIIGIFLLTYTERGISIGRGEILTLVGALFFTLHIVFVDMFSEGRDMIALTVIQLVVCGIISYVSCVLTSHRLVIPVPRETLPSVLYLGVVASGVAFLIQNVAQKYTQPTHAGIIMSLESVFGCLLGILILHEQITVKTAFGSIIIFIALVLAETKCSFLLKKSKVQKNPEETIHA